MSIRAGRLRHMLEFQSPTGSRDAVGERTTVWNAVASVWGGVEPLRANEVIAASQANMRVTHRIIVRYDSSIASMTIGWRIVRGSNYYDIRGIRNLDEKDKVFELICEEGLLYRETDVITYVDVLMHGLQVTTRQMLHNIMHGTTRL